MSDLLAKIIERYELDKPILMKDKLDIICDDDNHSNSRIILDTIPTETSEQAFQRILAEKLEYFVPGSAHALLGEKEDKKSETWWGLFGDYSEDTFEESKQDNFPEQRQKAKRKLIKY